MYPLSMVTGCWQACDRLLQNCCFELFKIQICGKPGTSVSILINNWQSLPYLGVLLLSTILCYDSSAWCYFGAKIEIKIESVFNHSIFVHQQEKKERKVVVHGTTKLYFFSPPPEFFFACMLPRLWLLETPFCDQQVA